MIRHVGNSHLLYVFLSVLPAYTILGYLLKFREYIETLIVLCYPMDRVKLPHSVSV